jgi:hypothetical protein
MSADKILPDLFRHDTEWNVAICTLCQHAVAGKTLRRHAKDTHQIPYRESKSCIEALHTKSILHTLEEFPNPANGIPAITGLKVYDGFKCSMCTYLTTSEILMEKHAQKHPGMTDYCRPSKLQV